MTNELLECMLSLVSFFFFFREPRESGDAELLLIRGMRK
jgi:hypothetical protein